MANWNNAASYPARPVKAGDRIVAVNGVSGRGGDKALEVLKSETDLRIIVRPCPVVRPAVYQHVRVAFAHDVSRSPTSTPTDEGDKKSDATNNGTVEATSGWSWWLWQPFCKPCVAKSDADTDNVMDSVAVLSEEQQLPAPPQPATLPGQPNSL